MEIGLTSFSFLIAMRNSGARTVATTRQLDGWSLAVMPADGFFEHSYPGLPVLISDTSFPTIFDVGSSTSSSKGLTAHFDFDAYHTLALVVYLFSNNLQQSIDDEHMMQLINNLANRSSRNLLSKLFMSDEPSIRAVWESLFEIASKYTVRSGLQLLIGISLELHRDWVDGRIDDIVFAAVSIGDTTLLQKLLEERPTWNSGTRINPTYFSAAAMCSAVHCAEILLTRCDPNAKTVIDKRQPQDEPTSIFIMFLHELSYTTNQPAYAKIFSLFIAAGADVDTPYPYNLTFGAVNLGWKLTCLDLCAYKNLRMTTEDSLSSYSHTYKSMFTRAGICDALAEGQDAVAKYLECMRPPRGIKLRDCLRAILIEQFQFIFSQWENHGEKSSGAPAQISEGLLARAQALLEYGVSMRAWYTWSPSYALRSIIQSAASLREKDFTYFLSKAIEAGAGIEWDTYAACKAENDLPALKTLLSHDADRAVNGRRVLLNAAKTGSYEAIALLLEQGVDVNSELLQWSVDQGYRQATLFANLLTYPYSAGQNDIREKRKVWRHLIEKGAELRFQVGHTTSYQLLRAIICSPSAHQWHAFKFVLESDKDISHISSSQWTALLDLATSKDGISFPMIKTLFRRCGSSSEPMLARAIMSGCNLAFVEELINAGEAVNDYSAGDRHFYAPRGKKGREPSSSRSPLQAAAILLDVAMVARLLELGAEINSPTLDEAQSLAFQLALRSSLTVAYLNTTGALFGMTALQVVCRCHPNTLETMERQGHLIKLLVNHGANINANAHGQYASTALQLLCRSVSRLPCDFAHTRQLVRFFVDKGADVNIAPGFFTFTALQECARRGDIELAVLLVENGADPNAYPGISSDPDANPENLTEKKYGSALDLAAREGRLDMTQYLLNIGALSISPGNTGYRGALNLAIKMKHHAVAEIIRTHARKTEQEFQSDAQLRVRHSERIKRHATAKWDREAEHARFLDFRLFS
jgi:hypothetical protein